MQSAGSCFVECLFCAGLWIRLGVRGGGSKEVTFSPNPIEDVMTVEPDRERYDNTGCWERPSTPSVKYGGRCSGSWQRRNRPQIAVPCWRPWGSLIELVRRVESGRMGHES